MYVSPNNLARVEKGTPDKLKIPGVRRFCRSVTLHAHDMWKTRPSLSQWSKALGAARGAQDILIQCNRGSLPSWEDAGSRGLSSLNERLQMKSTSQCSSDISPVFPSCLKLAPTLTGTRQR